MESGKKVVTTRICLSVISPETTSEGLYRRRVISSFALPTWFADGVDYGDKHRFPAAHQVPSLTSSTVQIEKPSWTAEFIC